MADAHFPPPRFPLPKGRFSPRPFPFLGILSTRIGGTIAIGTILALLMALALLPVIVPAGALVRDTAKRLGNVPPLPKVNSLAQRSTIRAANGAQLATIFDENRVYVPLKKIPKYVRNAVVAIEDDRFYEHQGVDFRGIARAAVTNIRSGDIEQGGSTLTQQFVKKNVIQDESQTLDRKVREAMYAVQLEKQMSKEQILEQYLNLAAFGEGVYGIGTAAQHYFGGKRVSQLTLSEAASLAATIKSPENYKPTNPKLNIPRRDLVLDRMQALGFAKPQDVARAKKQKLKVKPFTPKKRQPTFVEWVKLQLLNDPAYNKVLGKAGSERRKKAVYQGGLDIRTTLEPSRQQQAQAAVRDKVRQSPDGRLDGALASVDPTTGRIVAMVGGTKSYNDSKVNLATLDNGSNGFQSGSSYKMFYVVAALEKGIPVSKAFKSPARITIPDRRCFDGGEPWNLGNAADSEAGTFNLYGATEHSVNTYFAQLAVEVGPERATDVAKRMGVSNAGNMELNDAGNPKYGDWNACASVLGTNTVSVLDMASAFGTLANKGVHCKPFAIASIKGPDGKVLYERKPSCEQAIEPGIANQAVDILRTVIASGTGTAAQLGRPVAGKTGTADEYKSAFFNGFVPQLSTSVWVGVPRRPTPMRTWFNGGPVFGGTYPALIFQQYMRAALEGQPVIGFPAPPKGRPKPPKQEGEKGVPKVTGRQLDQAIRILTEAGYRPSVRTTRSSEPLGRVVRQSPKAGDNAPPGSTVTLEVSDGSGRGRRDSGGGGGDGGG